MCGRFTPIPRPQVLEQFRSEFGIEVTESLGPETQAELTPCGGGQCLPFRDIDVLFSDREGRILLMPMQWQLIHNWNREFRSDYTNFNTRYEKLDKPHNRDLLRFHRCIVPVAEFFENRKVGGRTVKPKESYRFTVRGQRIIPLGGIYSIWINPEDEDDRRFSCSVITMEPNGLVGEIHNRMPFIVPREVVPVWLDRSHDSFDEAKEMIRPFEAGAMTREREGATA